MKCADLDKPAAEIDGSGRESSAVEALALGTARKGLSDSIATPPA